MPTYWTKDKHGTPVISSAEPDESPEDIASFDMSEDDYRDFFDRNPEWFEDFGAIELVQDLVEALVAGSDEEIKKLGNDVREEVMDLLHQDVVEMKVKKGEEYV